MRVQRAHRFGQVAVGADFQHAVPVATGTDHFPMMMLILQRALGRMRLQRHRMSGDGGDAMKERLDVTLEMRRRQCSVISEREVSCESHVTTRLRPWFFAEYSARSARSISVDGLTTPSSGTQSTPAMPIDAVTRTASPSIGSVVPASR